MNSYKKEKLKRVLVKQNGDENAPTFCMLCRRWESGTGGHIQSNPHKEKMKDYSEGKNDNYWSSVIAESMLEFQRKSEKLTGFLTLAK